MIQASMLSVLLVLLALASGWDVARHRIPNALVVGIAATGLLARSLDGGGIALGSGVLAVGAVFAMTWLAWTRGWIGGGDLKLATAAAAWLGIQRVPVYLLASALAVGGVSVLCYVLSARTARAEVRRNLAFAARGVPVSAPLAAERGRARVPAGAAFAIGAVVTVAMSGGL